MAENIEVIKVETGLHEVDSKINDELKKYMPGSLSEYRPNDPEQPDAV
jgi:hypothetical protein